MKSIQDIFESACLNGCLDVVKVCVEKGVDIHYSHNWVLIQSIAKNQYEVVKYLLENGANPYYGYTDWVKQDAFWSAEYYNRTEIASLLEQYRR